MSDHVKSQKGISRRHFLQLTGAGLSGAFLAACTVPTALSGSSSAGDATSSSEVIELT